MAEPLTPTSLTSVGLAALLTGAVGAVAADVMMVILASIAGVVISLSAKTTTPMQALRFFFGALMTSLTLAWALATLIGNLHPSLNSAYTPTMVAFIIGTQSHRLSEIVAKITGRVEKKLEEETK